jgi:mono/diheme cytochrome c family protein
MCCVLVLCLLLTLGLEGYAQEHGIHPSGEALYLRYCASCHGREGKGQGPVASALRQPPSDLTTLARRAGGHFDEADVMAVIDGRRLVAAHGPREMPVWGVVFEEELKDQPYPQYTGLLRSRVLADYLRSLQQE